MHLKNVFNVLLLILTLTACGGNPGNAPQESTDQTMSDFLGLKWGSVSAADFLQKSVGEVKDWGDPVELGDYKGFSTFDFKYPGIKSLNYGAAFFSTGDSTIGFTRENFDKYFLESVVLVIDLKDHDKMEALLKTKYGEPSASMMHEGQPMLVWKNKETGRAISLKKTAITAKIWFLPLTAENENNPAGLSPSPQ